MQDILETKKGAKGEFFTVHLIFFFFCRSLLDLGCILQKFINKIKGLLDGFQRWINLLLLFTDI